MPTMDLLTFPVKDTVRIMAALLSTIAAANDPLVRTASVAISRFHTRALPPISVHAYLVRVLKYAPCPSLVFVAVLVYLDRMARARVPFIVCSSNVHRLLITAVMVATKFHSDVFYTNAHYAKVGGVSVAELNQLELEFLFMNEFNLMVPPEELQHYADRLLDHAVATKLAPLPISTSPVAVSATLAAGDGTQQPAQSAQLTQAASASEKAMLAQGPANATSTSAPSLAAAVPPVVSPAAAAAAVADSPAAPTRFPVPAITHHPGTPPARVRPAPTAPQRNPSSLYISTRAPSPRSAAALLALAQQGLSAAVNVQDATNQQLLAPPTRLPSLYSTAAAAVQAGAATSSAAAAAAAAVAMARHSTAPAPAPAPQQQTHLAPSPVDVHAAASPLAASPADEPMQVVSPSLAASPMPAHAQAAGPPPTLPVPRMPVRAGMSLPVAPRRAQVPPSAAITARAPAAVAARASAPPSSHAQAPFRYPTAYPSVTTTTPTISTTPPTTGPGAGIDHQPHMAAAAAAAMAAVANLRHAAAAQAGMPTTLPAWSAAAAAAAVAAAHAAAAHAAAAASASPSPAVVPAAASPMHPRPEDLSYETDLVQHPYSVRGWLKYLLHLDPLTTRPAHIAATWERAVRTLPGSYKLWKQYLAWCAARVRHAPRNSWAFAVEVQRVAGCYRRALLTLHKMPRLWTEYLTHLTANLAHEVATIRRAFDAALQALPTTQHQRVWDMYLPWAEKVGGVVAVQAHRRYLKIDPSRLYHFVKLLLDLEQYDAAATHLMKAITLHTDSTHGASFELFDKLCTLAVDHPSALTTVSVEDILRAGLRRFPTQSAKFWIALARHWIGRGRLERARAVFEEALRTVSTMRDFTQVFDAYLELEERVVSARMTELAEDEAEGTKTTAQLARAQREIDMRLDRLDRLMSSRALLVNDVLLRQNPHNVLEWLKRTTLVAADQVVSTFRKALATINPKHASGRLDELWVALAVHFEKEGNLVMARQVFEEAVVVEYKTVAELAAVWTEYADLELRAQKIDRALDLLGRATAIPANKNVDFKDPKISAQRRLFKSLALWSYYVDLEECFGTKESVVACYDAILALKIATPQVVVNYALYLEANEYYEDAFAVYERGIDLFGWPVALDLWNLYLAKFMARYAPQALVASLPDDTTTETDAEPAPTGVELERLRDLFEQAVDGCPPAHARALYLAYAHVEERHGLARRAMRVLDRATRAVPAPQQRGVYAYYIARVIHHFGLVAARDVYERAIANLPDAAAAETCLELAALEVRLGEVDRARAVFAHGAPLADPRTNPQYWARWHEFEVRFGNEDAFKEMLRIKRSVQAQFNTEVNYIAAQLAAARAKQKAAAERDAVEAAAGKGSKVVASGEISFVAASNGGAGGAVDGASGDEDEDDEMGGAGNRKQVRQVQEKAVPAAVFGKVLDQYQKEAPADADGKGGGHLGAKERLSKRRKV
ncbi:pre-mRNA-splicing factor syf1 [Allomyces arbusculus]|nr:pre-mRNA-splicing factor syf1 [Allomyces arbusculus]